MFFKLNTHNDDNIKHFTNSETHLLSEILYDRLSINSENFKTLLKLGAIYVNNERQTKDKFIPQNSLFRVHIKPRRFNCNFDWKSLIIFENDFFLVLNKPAGIPSHPSIDNVIENALTQTSLARGYPLFVTHRLDTLTSGLIVFGKKSSFVSHFNIQLQKRSIKKHYVALVESQREFPKRLTHYMDPSPGTPKKLSDDTVAGWSVCELEIVAQKKISQNPNLTWLKLNLLTGRTHQIRAQLSFLNAPIQGDKLYGSVQAFAQNAIALRSCEIEFTLNDVPMKFNLAEEF